MSDLVVRHLEWIDRIFVINLDEKSPRWRKCIEQFQKYDIPYERFQAIDGKNIPSKLRTKIHPICEYILCTDGMKGCGLSHYSLLKKIVDENIQTVVILEDDFLWKDDTLEKIDQLKDFHDGIVKLSCHGPFCKKSLDKPEKAFLPADTAAYLLRNKHAKMMLDVTEKIYYHVDFQYLFLSKRYSIPLYEFPCIHTHDQLDSSIAEQKESFITHILPLSDGIKSQMNEPVLCPLGFRINYLLLVGIVLLVLGMILRKKWIGKILIFISVLDIIYYLIV